MTSLTLDQIVPHQLAGDDRLRANIEKAVSANLFAQLPAGYTVRFSLVDLRLVWARISGPTAPPDEPVGNEVPWSPGDECPEWANLVLHGTLDYEQVP